MSEFDQFANQGGPDQTAEELAESRRVADEQLKNADYAGDLPEPLGGGRHAADPFSTTDNVTEGAADAADPSHPAPRDGSGAAHRDD